MLSNLHNDANSCSTTSNESVSWSSSTSHEENKIRAVPDQFLTHTQMEKRESGAAASKVKQAASSITSKTKYMNTPKRRSLFLFGRKKSKKILANKNRELEATTTTIAIRHAASEVKQAASSITSTTKYMNTPKRRSLFLFGKKKSKKILANKNRELELTTITIATITNTTTATPLALTNDVSSARLIHSQKIDNKSNSKSWMIIKTEAMQNAFFNIGQYLFLVLAVVVMFQIPFVILGFAALGFIQSMAYTLGWVKFIFAVNDYDFEDNSTVRRSFMKRMNSRMFTYAWLSGVGTALSLVEKKVNSGCNITELKKSGTKSLIKSIDERIESFNPKAQN